MLPFLLEPLDSLRFGLAKCPKDITCTLLDSLVTCMVPCNSNYNLAISPGHFSIVLRFGNIHKKRSYKLH